jgi:hypothetical protein
MTAEEAISQVERWNEILEQGFSVQYGTIKDFVQANKNCYCEITHSEPWKKFCKLIEWQVIDERGLDPCDERRHKYGIDNIRCAPLYKES